MAETILLDPSAVATSRTQVDITPFISSDGVDWSDASIEQNLADGRIGSDPIDYRLPNRHVTIPLRLTQRGTVTFDTIRRQLQAKVGLFQREQGWLSRVTSAGTLFADVVNASLKLGGDWMQANRSIDVNAELALELSPDWYGAEVTLDDMVETTASGIYRVLKLSSADAAISGDYPARVRIVVDDDQGASQLGIMWGFRSRYYDSAATAALNYQAEALTPLDVAGTATVSSTLCVQHANLTTDWTPVLSTQAVGGGAHMTHRGTYRAWARCYTTSAAGVTLVPQITVRLLYDVGDLTLPTELAGKAIPTASNWCMLDLGEIRLDAAPVGTHRWQGQIQAKAVAAGQNIAIDQVFFQPLDDGAGLLTAPVQLAPVLSSFTARDEFTSTTAGGTIHNRVAPLGGTWSSTGSGTDFTFVDSPGEAISRATTDSSSRYATLGTATPSSVVVSGNVRVSSNAPSWSSEVVCRWTSLTRYLSLVIQPGPPPTVSLVYTSGANASILGQITNLALPDGEWVSCAVAAYSNGYAIGQFGQRTMTGFHTDLATGGLAASGKVGLGDTGFGGAGTRYYDDFRVWVPSPDAVVYASQSAELRTEGMFREDATGTAYGPVSLVGGDLPRLPPSGLEGRKVELFLKGSRGDLDQLPDTGVDDVSARVFYRPAWLTSPGS